jgi:hypothetical protein
MSRLAAYVAFWDRREPPTALVLVRVLVSVVLLADFLSAAGSGLVTAVWAAPPDGLGYAALPPLVRLLGGATPHTAWILWGVAVGALVLFGLGAATRAAGVAFVLASASLGLVAPDSDRGIDILLRVVVGVLVFSGCHARWSVDALVRRRLGRPFAAEQPAWPRYLLFAQLVWMYFSAGINKGDPHWGPAGGFSALAMILSDPHFARWDAGWLASVYPLTQVATVTTMAFEYGAPLFLLATLRPGRAARLFRLAWLGLGVSFHLGIAVTMRLGIFPFGMLAVWPVFFSIRPHSLRSLVRPTPQPGKAGSGPLS